MYAIRSYYEVAPFFEFGEEVATAIGFDFDRGRLDVSAHPFSTSIGPGDSRITTRFDAHDFCDGFV